jgi:quercetin dioxygenase-like cupin family protein
MLKTKKTLIKTCITLTTGILIGAFGMGALHAQQSGIKRTVLLKHELSVQGRDAVMGHAEIMTGMETGKHAHPGEEMGYVLEGEMVLEAEGKPARTLKPGDTYFIEAGQAHNAKTSGNSPAKVLAVYVVEKDKPFASPVK